MVAVASSAVVDDHLHLLEVVSFVEQGGLLVVDSHSSVLLLAGAEDDAVAAAVAAALGEVYWPAAVLLFLPRHLHLLQHLV